MKIVVKKVNDELAVSFPYDGLIVSQVKTIPGRIF